VYGPDPLQHPYSYVLFLGQDARGHMLPYMQLCVQCHATDHGKSCK
jgi:hypothetical protein